jgi:hypothetical protein
MYHRAFSLGKYTRRASKRFCPEICDLHVQILLQKVQFVCENDVSAAFIAEHFFCVGISKLLLPVLHFQCNVGCF